MRRLTSAGIVASLALLAGSAGSAGARPALIAPPALGKAHSALDTAYAEEELALFTLSDFASAAGRAEAPGALERSQAALGEASSALSNGGLPSSVSGDVADAQDAANKIGRIDDGGEDHAAEARLQQRGPGRDRLAAERDARLRDVQRLLGRRDLRTGRCSETEIQNGGRNPNALTVGPGGQLFVTEYTANKIGRVAVG